MPSGNGKTSTVPFEKSGIGLGLIQYSSDGIGGLGFGYDDHMVAFAKHCSPARDLGSAISNDRGNEHIARKLQFSNLLTVSDRPAVQVEFKHFDVSLQERRDLGYVAAHETQHTVRSCGSRREGCVDTNLIEQRQKVQAVHDRNCFGHAGGLGVDRREDVRVIFARERSDEFDTSKIGLVEHVGVGDVAMEDSHAIERLGELAGTVYITFDQLHARSGMAQLFRDEARRSATAEQEDLAGHVAGEAEQLCNLSTSGTFTHHSDEIVGVDRVVTARDQGFFAALDRRDDEVPFGFVLYTDLDERLADDRCVSGTLAPMAMTSPFASLTTSDAPGISMSESTS